MTYSAQELEDAEARAVAAKAETREYIDTSTSTTSDVIKSPIVIGGALLGVAVAGYALFKSTKQAPSISAATRPRGPGTFLPVVSALAPLIATISSRSGSNDEAFSGASHPENEKAKHSAFTDLDNSALPTKHAPQAAVAASEVKLDQSSSSWISQQWQLCRAAAIAWVDDYAPSMGAALSYYTLFSLAPLLVIVIATAGLIFGQDAAQGAIVAQLGGIMGTEGASAVQDLLKAAREPSTGIVASIVGGLLLLLGSTAIFAELQSALDRIWRVPAKEKQSGVWSFLRSRVLSFGLVLGLGFLLMVSLVVSAALAASGEWLGVSSTEGNVFATVLNFAVSFGIFTVLFAMIYKIMPSAKISWHDVWMGSAVTALLFNLGKTLIGLYLAKTSVASGFGAAGSFVVLIAWFYYSAQIFLFGAEYTWVYSTRNGAKPLAS